MDRKETNMTEPNPWQAPEQPVPAPALPQAGEEQPVTGCSFKDAIIRYWKGYVRFRGRASRSEYWWAMLFTFLVWFAFSLLDQSGSGFLVLFFPLSRRLCPAERLLGTRHHPTDHRHLMASPP